MRVLRLFNNDSFLNYFFPAIAILLFLHYCWRLTIDSNLGGEPWKQGDWLINSQIAPIRRSLTGDLFIWISDSTGADVLALVIFFQIFATLLLFLLVILLVRSDETGALALLALSAAFFMFFWAADPQGAGRKEILAFTSMALIARSIQTRHALSMVAGFGLFPIAVLSHEAMILFLPVISLTYLICFRGMKGRPLFHICFFLSAILSLIALYNVMSTVSATDISVVCDPLLQRGLDPIICDGAIRWLQFDLDYGRAKVASQLAKEYMPLSFLFAYGVSLAPAIYVCTISSDRRLSALIVILSGLAFLPLYFVAVDFGRWMSFHIFSIFFLFSAAFASGKIRLTRPIELHVLFIAVAAAALFGPKHTVFIFWGGAARRISGDLLRYICGGPNALSACVF